MGTSCCVTLAISTGTTSPRPPPAPGAFVAAWLPKKRHNKIRSKTRTRTLTICTMRARVRRGRRTPVGAATATWLAPVDVAGASAERFSFIAYLISAVHCKLTSANKQPAPAMLVHRSFRSLECFTETRLRDLCSHICLRRRKDLGYEKLLSGCEKYLTSTQSMLRLTPQRSSLGLKTICHE